MMAAGMAFYFLLGLIPFLFITTAITGYLFRNNPGFFSHVSTNLLALLPPGLGERILSQIGSAASNWQTLSVLGLLSLFLVAMGVFESIDWGINTAMGERKKVGFLKGRLVFAAYVTGAVIYFSLAAVANYAFELALASPGLASLNAHIPRRAWSMAAMALFLFILYMTVTVRTPAFHRALLVSFGVAGIWAGLQKAGAVLTVYISRRHAIYGALAGGTVFLTWMYLFALTILIGATVLDVWERTVKDGWRSFE